MHKSDYSAHFSLELTPASSEVFFGMSHFFNRARTVTGWKSYHEVLHNNQGGRLLLGQLPIDSFNAELLKDLSPDGLIVACNECFELSGCGTAFQVTNPFLWHQAGIDHYHLPFTDFSDNAEPQLILEALAKMLAVYQRGGTIYLHCKAGRSRSALIAALFMTVIELQDLPFDPNVNSELLEQALSGKEEELKRLRRQVNIGQDKIRLGVSVLQQLLNPKIETADEVVESYTQSGEFFAKLTQAPAFKSLWYYAYNNPADFEDMQVLMSALKEDPLEVLNVLNSLKKTTTNLELKNACLNIKANKMGAQVLMRLRTFLSTHKEPDFQPEPTALQTGFQRLNEALTHYRQEPSVIKIASRLQSAIFLSSAPDEDKAAWLEETVQFLNDPEHWARSYYMNAENAVLSDNPSTRKLGKGMVLLGAAVLITILLAGALSATTFTLPVVISVAAAALAFMVIGRLVTNSAADDSVKEHSRELVSEFNLLDEADSFYQI